MFGVGSIILKGPGINYKRHETGESIGIFFSNFFLGITGEGFCKLNLYVQVVRTAGPPAKLLSSSCRSLHAYNVKISPCTNILRRPQANHYISITHGKFEVFIFFLGNLVYFLFHFCQNNFYNTSKKKMLSKILLLLVLLLHS